MELQQQLRSLIEDTIQWAEENQPELYFDRPIQSAPRSRKRPQATPIQKPLIAETKPQPRPAKRPDPVKKRLEPKAAPMPEHTPPAPVKKPVRSDLSFELSKPREESQEQLSDISTTFQKACPQVLVQHEIPSDRKAKIAKHAWKIKSKLIDVPIFMTAELRPFAPFLHNLARAIDMSIAPSRVIEIDVFEQKDLWDTTLDPSTIKLIVCPDLVLWASPRLVTHYKRLPVKNSHKLKEIDLLLLPDLALYTKDPLLKRSLWNMLTTWARSSNQNQRPN